MKREDFMQLCERAADFCDVCTSCSITFTKCDGNSITLTVSDKPMTLVTTEGGGHQLRELH